MEFTHKKLRDSSCFIRLFRIAHDASNPARLNLILTEHSIAEVDFDNQQGTHYTALSYMWGPPEPSHEIQINQHPFRLRENLFHFLSNLTAHEKEATFWADAVCINQGDIEERSAQVAIMGTIFESAANVLAWVGQPDFDVEVLFFSPETASTELNLHKLGKFSTRTLFTLERNVGSEHVDRMSVRLETLNLAMEHFARREYWKRLWIIQELGLGREVVIACGPHRASLVDMRELNLALRRKGAGDLFRMDASYLEIVHHDARSDLETLIFRHGDARCADPRDRIFGIRGLTNDATDDLVKPDYSKNVTDLYWEVLPICGCETSIRQKLLQVLGISVDQIVQDFKVRLRSSPPNQFSTQNCGEYLCIEDSVEIAGYPERRQTVQKHMISRRGGLMEFATESGTNWYTFATVKAGDLVVQFTNSNDEQLLAAVFTNMDGPRYTGSWAVEKGAHSQSKSDPLEWLEENCPPFETFQPIKQGQETRRFEPFEFPMPNWIITPPVVIALLLLDVPLKTQGSFSKMIENKRRRSLPYAHGPPFREIVSPADLGSTSGQLRRMPHSANIGRPKRKRSHDGPLPDQKRHHLPSI